MWPFRKWGWTWRWPLVRRSTHEMVRGEVRRLTGLLFSSSSRPRTACLRFHRVS